MMDYFIPVIILAVIGMVLQGFFIAVDHKGKYAPAVFFKGSAAMVFVVIGFMADKNLLICLGLTFGMIGDILLALRYNFRNNTNKVFMMAGSFMFFIGHIMYIAAEIPESWNLKISISIGVGVAAVILYIIYKNVELDKLYKAFGVFYIGVVSIMTAIAVGNVIHDGSAFRIWFAVGAVLFTVSDVIMVLNGRIHDAFLRVMNLSLYYVGQLLIALSMFFIE